MSRIYEGMFLIDNDTVRAGWTGAKSKVIELVQKHGGTIHTARRWDERKLTYPIRHKNRATFLLSYYEVPQENIPHLIRDLDINETVMRYLLLKADAVPDEERKLSEAENATDFVVPEPPADDAPEEREFIPTEYDEDGEPRPVRRPREPREAPKESKEPKEPKEPKEVKEPVESAEADGAADKDKKEEAAEPAKPEPALASTETNEDTEKEG